MPMSDAQAADFYARPENQQLGERIVSRRVLSSSIPVRFPPGVVEAVKASADAQGVTMSAWIRRAVSDALTAVRAQPDTPAAIVDDLRRDLDRLAAKLG